jgi:hypothetical protein
MRIVMPLWYDAETGDVLDQLEEGINYRWLHEQRNVNASSASAHHTEQSQ